MLMTLVSCAVLLSLTSSGRIGLFSVFGSTVAAGLGFLGDRLMSVPFPKAWMAFPGSGRDLGRLGMIKRGKKEQGRGSALRRQGFSVKSRRNFSHSSSIFPLPLQEHQGEMVMLVVLAST